jgi:lipid-A-disaccharide synthase
LSGSRKIYFVAGEVSGDDHGAALMRALRDLRPDLQFSGRGGPKMKEAAGGAFHNWIHDAGVVGLWEVIRKYPYFRGKFHETLEQIRKEKPDAVVLIDYPGFNLRLARALQRGASSLKLIYYVSPQIWAWNRGRIKKMAHWLDLMLCIFPFEADLYNASGLRTIFVGHPMIDRLSAQRTETSRDQNLIGLFPGSRPREVRKISPIMLKTAMELLRTNPGLRFEIAASWPELAQEIRTKLELAGKYKERFQVRLGSAAEILQHAFAGMIASGTATQEAAYFRLPFVLVYKVSWLTYLVGRSVVKVDYLGMPNLLANREIVPEFIQHQAKPGNIAKALRPLIDNSVERSEMISAFDEIVGSLGKGGASDRAARAILEELDAAT